jgi:hypothetical protein
MSEESVYVVGGVLRFMGVDSTVRLVLVFLANVGVGMVDEGGSLSVYGHREEASDFNWATKMYNVWIDL